MKTGSLHKIYAFNYASIMTLRLGNEKNILKPVLLNGRKDENAEVKMAAETAIQDINNWMKWNIGGAQKRKAQGR